MANTNDTPQQGSETPFHYYRFPYPTKRQQKAEKAVRARLRELEQQGSQPSHGSDLAQPGPFPTWDMYIPPYWPDSTQDDQS